MVSLSYLYLPSLDIDQYGEEYFYWSKHFCFLPTLECVNGKWNDVFDCTMCSAHPNLHSHSSTLQLRQRHPHVIGLSGIGNCICDFLEIVNWSKRPRRWSARMWISALRWIFLQSWSDPFFLSESALFVGNIAVRWKYNILQWLKLCVTKICLHSIKIWKFPQQMFYSWKKIKTAQTSFFCNNWWETCPKDKCLKLPDRKKLISNQLHRCARWIIRPYHRLPCTII